MRVKNFFTVLIAFLATILTLGGIVRLSVNRNNNMDSGDSSGSSHSGVSDSSPEELPFDPYDGVSGNRTRLVYDIPEDNLTISFAVDGWVNRVIFSSAGEKENEYEDDVWVCEGYQDITTESTVEYTFSTPGVKRVEIFDAKSINDRSFYNETRLLEARMGHGVETIGKYAFHGTSNMRNVYFSETVESIAYGSFMKSGLETISIPSFVKSIGEYAFAYCYSALFIEVFALVEAIPNYAFAYCKNANHLEVTGAKSIEESAFSGFQSLTELVISDMVEMIGPNAFANSHNIITLTIGANVRTICEGAFKSFEDLQEVICLSENPPTLGADVFYGWKSIQKIYVPSESAKELYQSSSDWGVYSDIIFVSQK